MACDGPVITAVEGFAPNAADTAGAACSVFFAAVAAIEPDPVFPVIFAVIVLAAMAWSYRRSFPASGGPEARASTCAAAPEDHA
jgi:hypothetical protein